MWSPGQAVGVRPRVGRIDGPKGPVPPLRPLLVVDIVGLTPRLLPHAPRIRAIADSGFVAPIEPVVPAVTTSVQSTYLTGLPVREHGVVGNGWYHRDTAEIRFWLQSNRLVHGEKVWETGRRRDPAFTCAKLFWWFNMYSTADIAVTPRPAYPADGRKIPDIYTEPAALHDRLVDSLGAFPLFKFWGPGADATSSRWIVDCARHVLDADRPTLTLVYVPHLDYDLQRFGPDGPEAIAAVEAVDALVAPLIERARESGVDVIALSEYGIERASGVIVPNRALREAGLLRIQRNAVGELLDAGASRAFAVCDHQIAHVYVDRPADVDAARRVLTGLDGVDRVLDRTEQAALGLDHPRSGELVALAGPGHWFAYPYWLDETEAPDFARTVDIHRKPGYDPVELFLDPAAPGRAKARAMARLAQKALGFRYLMDVIGLDPSVVGGTHGRAPDDLDDGAVLLSSRPTGAADRIAPEGVRDLILETIFADR